MSFLHITNGDHARDVIVASGIPGTVSIWADPLNEGPVPGGISDALLRTIRARFLAGAGRGDRFQAVLAQLDEWAAALDRRSEYSETVLWFEHDLFDQLLLIRHLWWLRDKKGTRFSLVCGQEYLGLLRPDQFPELFDARNPITPAISWPSTKN